MRREEGSALPLRLQLWATSASDDWSLAIHGGAGGRVTELGETDRVAFESGLAHAWNAGAAALAEGASALDATCAAVQTLEDDPLFNAGRGAALTLDGHAELDAAVMDGRGAAGAVAGSRHARNPVLAARAVMEQTEHVLMLAPSRELVAEWGLSSADEGYFVTDARVRQLERLREARSTGPRHGTVGAVARDRSGNIAAATSTGGMAGQRDGRVGDTPIIGSGTYARNGSAALSCTGEGEAFIRGVVSYDIVARMRYRGQSLKDAVEATFAEELTACGASGGLVAVDQGGRIVVAHNSPTMYAAFDDGSGLAIHT